MNKKHMRNNYDHGYSLVNFLLYTLCTSLLAGALLTFSANYIKHLKKIEASLEIYTKTEHCISSVMNMTQGGSIMNINNSKFYNNKNELPKETADQLYKVVKPQLIDSASALIFFIITESPFLLEKDGNNNSFPIYKKTALNYLKSNQLKKVNFLFINPWNSVIVNDRNIRDFKNYVRFSNTNSKLFHKNLIDNNFSYDNYPWVLEIRNAGFIYKSNNDQLKIYSITEKQNGTLCSDVSNFLIKDSLCSITLKEKGASHSKVFVCKNHEISEFETLEALEKWTQ